MQLGLAISVLLHSGLIAWAYLIMLSTAKLEPPQPEPITVALITPSELLQLKKGSETAKELAAKAKEEPKPEVSRLEAEKPKPVTAPTPPQEPAPPKQEAVARDPPPPLPPKSDAIGEKLAALSPSPPPGPSPDELRKIEDQKSAAEEERKKVAEKRKAEERKKEEELRQRVADRKKKAEEKNKAEAQKKTAADRLAALLDKDPTKKGAPQPAAPVNDTAYAGPTAGAREGTHSVLSAREQDLLRGQLSAQLEKCWRLIGGGGGIEMAVVTVSWRLMPDGTLDGQPTIQNPLSGQVFQIAAEAAMRAVISCAPFDLPADKYAVWKSITWVFDPQELTR